VLRLDKFLNPGPAGLLGDTQSLQGGRAQCSICAPPPNTYIPRLAKHIYCAALDPSEELTATYEELLAQTPAPDWSTASGRALFYRLSLAFPWPEASVDDPNAAHARVGRAAHLHQPLLPARQRLLLLLLEKPPLRVLLGVVAAHRD
jgi:hypothetical protein